MNPANIIGNPNRFSCSHCQCSTAGISSKLLTDYLNIAGPDLATHPHLKPTILEAITLIFGFRMPAPEVVINTTTGIQYFNTNGQSYHSLSICINCESILTNLYKVFLLFTELSNGKESFILRNSIISGRLQKEEEVIPLLDTRDHGQNPVPGNVYVDTSRSQLSALSRFPGSGNTSASATTGNPSMNTICRELSSEVVAEMYVPNAPSGITITPIITGCGLGSNSSGSNPLQRKSTQKPLPSLYPRTNPGKSVVNSANSSTSGSGPGSTSGPTGTPGKKKPVEIITLEDEDIEPLPSTSSSSNSTNNKQTHLNSTPKKVPQRFVPFDASSPLPNPKVAPTGLQIRSLLASLTSLERSPIKRPAGAPILTAQIQRPRLSSPPRQPQPAGVKDSSALSSLSNRRGMVTRMTGTTAKFKCESCPYHFPTLDSLLAHADKEHGDKEGVGPNRCRYCPRSFQTPSLLQVHLRYHNKESSLFLCRAAGCQKGYHELRLLRRHQTMTGHAADPELEAKRNEILLAAFTSGGSGPVPASATETESDADYWTTGIQVIHDPEQVMKKVEASAMEKKQNGATT